MLQATTARAWSKPSKPASSACKPATSTFTGCTFGTDSRPSKRSCARSTTSSARAKCSTSASPMLPHGGSPKPTRSLSFADGRLLSGLQVEYSLIERIPERELMPMAQALNIGLTVWSPLAGGVLTGKYHGHGPSEQARLSSDMLKDFHPEQQRAD